MGDRVMVNVKEDEKDKGVFLYGHWSGDETPRLLQKALKKHWRWDDASYLARIIFEQMTIGQRDTETGYGIMNHAISTDHGSAIEVWVEENIIRHGDKKASFDDFINLSATKLKTLLW
jgi:hypothetical protein